jgi:hypothetical protein
MNGKKVVAACMLALGLVLAQAVPARAGIGVSVGLFTDDLAPYGRWVNASAYGQVFIPNVSVGWRPYTVGHWVWTDDYGWLWTSDEDFGWAVYHYGRWYDDPVYGWAWVPGDEWAPAWVSWRYGGGYVGWAPLAPRFGWSVGVGFGFGGAQFDAFIQPRDYCFVPQRAFLDVNLSRSFVPVGRNVAIVRETRNITTYSAVGGRVVNRGPSIGTVEAATGRRVEHVRPVDVASSRDLRGVRGNQVTVFRPPSVRTQAERGATGRAPARSFDQRGAERTTRGNERAPEARTAGRTNAERTNEARTATRGATRAEAPRAATQQQRAEQQRYLKTQETQRQQLEKRQAYERKDLERFHQNEIKSVPKGTTSPTLARRQAEDHRNLTEMQHRQQVQMESQHTAQNRERSRPPAAQHTAARPPAQAHPAPRPARTPAPKEPQHHE